MNTNSVNTERSINAVLDRENFYLLLDTFQNLRVRFNRKDGKGERVMICTSIVPEDKKPKNETSRNESLHEGLVVVFDKEKNDWRSFYLDNIIELDILGKDHG